MSKSNFSIVRENEIVISGMSGRFPKSPNINELLNNLYNKIDMCTENELRFRHISGLPKRTGVINGLEKFDAEFFDINSKLAHGMDPQLRCALEHTYEAILDAGINPSCLEGTNTGVFGATSEVESDAKIFESGSDGYGAIGVAHAMFANYISYMFDLKGPSLVVDSACSTSMTALCLAYNSIRFGECDAAIVVGSHLTLSPVFATLLAK